MMQESILPFWTQEILQEENAAFPPRSAFMLESRNDDRDIDVEAEMDLSETLLPLTNDSGSLWHRHYRSKIVFVAKVVGLGIALFAATAVVVNIVARIAGAAIGGNHQEGLSVTFTLSLDEATTDKIMSVDHLAQILDIDTDDVDIVLFQSPQDQQKLEECLDCVQSDDGYESDNVAHYGENQFVLQLHISQNNSWMHETNQGEVERDLSSTIDSVNSAFDDSEKVLVIKLEEYLCEKIKEAFPETFEGTIGRICQLVQWDRNVSMAKEVITRATFSVLGNDRDEHGCIISAGYVWCESLSQCNRPWETKCEPSNGDAALYLLKNSVVGNDQDEHGCDRSAGYMWCESSNSCHREWETDCGESDSKDDKTTADGVVLVAEVA